MSIRIMFSDSGHSSKNELDSINVQSVSNSLEMKEDLIDVRQNIQIIPHISNDSNGVHIPVEGIETLTETFQNKEAELISTDNHINSEEHLELTDFSQHSQQCEEDEIPMEAVANAETTLNLSTGHYYDNLGTTPIMVYQMPCGNFVPFDSLVPVPIAKAGDPKASTESVDLLNHYSAQEIYINAQNTYGASSQFILPDTLKYKGQLNEKMFVSQIPIYSTEDTANLFLDAQQSLVRNNRCELSMAETMNTDLNLAPDENFQANSSGSSDPNMSVCYNSTTDSEVALTLASLGDVKNDKLHESLSVESSFALENTSKTLEDKLTFQTSVNNGKFQAHGFDNSHPENLQMKTTILTKKIQRVEVNTDIESRVKTKTVRSIQSKTQNIRNRALQQHEDTFQSLKSNENAARSLQLHENTSLYLQPHEDTTQSLQSYENATKNLRSHKNSHHETSVQKEMKSYEPRKKNLLGQLLKASKQCEPASLIPEGVVDDVIPAVGYRIIDVANLSEMIRTMHRCSSGSSKGLIVVQEQASLREGAVSHLSVICTGCKEGAICATSGKSHDNGFDINERVERLKKEFNIEESQFQKMLEILGIFYRLKPPPPPPSPSPHHPQDGEQSMNNASGEELEKKRKKTVKSNHQKLECKICHKIVSGKNYLKIHMLVHDNMLHTCPYCQAYFKRVFNLQQHIKKHENIKFECHHCHKRYTDRSTLYAHIKSIHLEEYRLECKTCSKRFFHKSHFEAHQRVHTKEKPFSCEVCGKSYAHMTSVKKHMQSHMPGTKYKCRLCGKLYKGMLGIRQHLVTQHKLKKCDIEAQVITEVMTETCPPSSKQTLESKNVESSVKIINVNEIQESDEEDVEEEGLNNYDKSYFENVPASSSSTTINFHSPNMSIATSKNLRNWRKPL